MQISPVTHAAQTAPAPENTTAATADGKTAPVSALAPSQVSAAIVQRANGDGDGRTGAAALNDGDAAARAAAVSRRIDVKA